jgi:hypothetical protein
MELEMWLHDPKAVLIGGEMSYEERLEFGLSFVEAMIAEALAEKESAKTAKIPPWLR